MGLEPLKVAISFQRLLNQVVGFLRLPAPTYSLAGEDGNNVNPKLVTDCILSPYIFEGGVAATLDASRENAAEQTIRFLRAQFGLHIVDITSENIYKLDQCAFLYEMKRIALESLNKPSVNGRTKWPAIPVKKQSGTCICIDYVDVLRVVAVATKARVSGIEVVELAANKWVSWLTIYTPSKAGMECICSSLNSSCKGAKQDAARRGVKFLRAFYNVDIVDLNYGNAVYSGIKCSLARESYMAVRERVLGKQGDLHLAPFLGGTDCLTPKSGVHKIPTPALPPAAPRKPKASSSFGNRPCARSASIPNAIYVPVPADLETVFKRRKT